MIIERVKWADKFRDSKLESRSVPKMNAWFQIKTFQNQFSDLHPASSEIEFEIEEQKRKNLNGKGGLDRKSQVEETMGYFKRFF